MMSSQAHRRRSPSTVAGQATEVETPQTKTKGGLVLSRHFWGVWFGIHGSVWENFVSIDLSGLWRRHVVWAKNDGGDLRNTVTARFASTTVFLSLIVGAELGVLFSPSTIVEVVRQALADTATDSLKFWTGIVLCVSIFFSISAMISNFTAWSIFIVVSKENSAMILRSSIGLYAAQMPNRLVMASTYLLYLWVAMFWWLILPRGAAIALSVAGILQIAHIASVYSAMGRLIMSSGAMSPEAILDKSEEEKLTPSELYDVLLQKAFEAKKRNIPVNMQYRQETMSNLALGDAHEGLHHRKDNREYSRDADNSVEKDLEAGKSGYPKL